MDSYGKDGEENWQVVDVVVMWSGGQGGRGGGGSR